MRILMPAALLAALVLAAPSASASADPWPLCLTEGSDYCVDIRDGEVCVTVFLGDLEGPYTHCEPLPATTGLPGRCTGQGDHYCYTIEDGRVCVTYDLGDLEGPYTTCVGK